MEFALIFGSGLNIQSTQKNSSNDLGKLGNGTHGTRINDTEEEELKDLDHVSVRSNVEVCLQKCE